MEKIDKFLCLIINGAFAFLLVFLCVKLCTGCTLVKRAVARERVVEAVRSAYDNGGREAVSNRIEKLVTDGTLSVKQGAKLHEIMRKAYDGLIRDVAKRIEDVAVGDETEDGVNEDANCGNCADCKARE